MSADLQAGAAAFFALRARLQEISDTTCGEDPDRPDQRDYRAMGDEVLRSLADNLGHRSVAHRQGYLRAITHLLAVEVDGGVASSDWDPLAATAWAWRGEGS